MVLKPSSRGRRVAVAGIATVVACLAVCEAAAQSAGATIGPPAGREKGGFSFGGEIKGRMNLIGPSSTDPTPTTPNTTLAPASMFAPDRLDRRAPAMIDGLNLPKIAPLGPKTPGQPQPNGTPAPIQAALPPAHQIAPIAKEQLSLSAVFDERSGRVPGGVKWRVFTEQPDDNGEHLMVAESSDAAPRFDLDPGDYIVHATYGLVSTTKVINVPPMRPSAQTLVLKAGAVRLSAFVGDKRTPDDAVSFTLTRDDGGVTRTVAEKVKAGELLRLPAGAYHVVSNYGDANAIVEADLQVAPGKLTDAQVHHRAGRVSLKLASRPGGGELPDTSWTILTPGGDTIRESIGALPNLVLAEGDYAAIARHDGRMFQQNFSVKPGVDAEVEVIAR